MIYRLKIQLKGVKKPPVWRRVLVNSEITFDDLHLVIQNAMGWGNYHLYQFGYRTYDRSLTIGIPSPDDWDPPKFNSKKTLISRFLNPDNPKMEYVYDFGDDWIHTITIEEAYDDPDIIDTLPICTDAKGACPPEDCGGPWGYENLKELHSTGELEEEDEERLEWYEIDSGFDPKYADLELINERLGELKAERKAKKAKNDDAKVRKLQERAELLKTLTAGCCLTLLDKKDLIGECEEVIDLLEKSENLDITKGSPEIWAAGLLIELYDYHYGFGFEDNQMSAGKICGFFNVKESSAKNRVYQIREELEEADDWRPELLCKPDLSVFEPIPEVQELVKELSEDLKSGKINSFEDLMEQIGIRLGDLTGDNS